jgi:hypothetical protein
MTFTVSVPAELWQVEIRLHLPVVQIIEETGGITYPACADAKAAAETLLTALVATGKDAQHLTATITKGTYTTGEDGETFFAPDFLLVCYSCDMLPGGNFHWANESDPDDDDEDWDSEDFHWANESDPGDDDEGWDSEDGDDVDGDA